MSKDIFHGFEEIAGQAFYSVMGLRNQNCKVQHVLRKTNPFGYSCDRCLNIDRSNKKMLPVYIFKMLIEEIRDIISCRVFHFHYGQSLFYNFDLPILRLFGKKIFMEFHGSDLRDPIMAYEINPFDINPEMGLTKRHKRLIHSACKWSTGIILHDDELIPYLPPKHPPVYVIPLKLDPYKLEPVWPSTDEHPIRIVHAPTNRYLKGSDYIEQAIDELSKKYSIEYLRVENMKQEQAFEIYKKADIIIDQLRTGTYGVFAIEGMALGKPVITYITEDMKSSFPDSLPIISANSQNIKNQIEYLLKDTNLRLKLGKEGREYVETYHDYRINSKMLVEIYEGRLAEITGKDAFRRIKELHDESRDKNYE